MKGLAVCVLTWVVLFAFRLNDVLFVCGCWLCLFRSLFPAKSQLEETLTKWLYCRSKPKVIYCCLFGRLFCWFFSGVPCGF